MFSPFGERIRASTVQQKGRKIPAHSLVFLGVFRRIVILVEGTFILSEILPICQSFLHLHSTLAGFDFGIGKAVFGVGSIGLQLGSGLGRCQGSVWLFGVGVGGHFGLIELFYLSGEGFLIFTSGDLIGDDSVGIDRFIVLFPQLLFYFPIVTIAYFFLFSVLPSDSPQLLGGVITGLPLQRSVMFHTMKSCLAAQVRNQMNNFFRSRQDPFRSKCYILQSFYFMSLSGIIARRVRKIKGKGRESESESESERGNKIGVNDIDSIIRLYQLMSEILSKTETRGRPRKTNEQKLPPISRKLFSEHSAVFYASCMVYVLEVFLKTKQEKRIGHSEGGFTLYEKINALYCFESFEDDVREWGFAEVLLANPALAEFAKTANGCAPKFVFKELLTLFVQIHLFLKEQQIQTPQELESSQGRLLNSSEADLNRRFKYIRFTPPALRELKMDRWSLEVAKRIRELWGPFIKILSYTLFCLQKNIDHNKYLKPFFSDAERPQETIIGQLNLEQIVQEKEERNLQSSVSLGFMKIEKSGEQDQNEKEKEKLGSELEGGSLLERTPLTNRRPITLITHPSSHCLEVPSPAKVAPLSNHYSRSLEDLEQIVRLPSKKVKKE